MQCMSVTMGFYKGNVRKNHTEMMQTPIPVISIQPYPAVKEPLEDVVKPTEQTPLVQEHHVLEELSSTDRLLITKRSTVRNLVFLRGKKNRFFVRTPEQNLIYTIEEQNSWWMGYFCYGLRPLQLHVKDNEGVEVMRIDRPFACTSRILPCQLQRIQVFAPPGTPIGSIEQQWTPVRPEYVVKREDGEQIFWVKGPFVTISCFNDIQFHIYKRDGTTVGSTCKRWQGLVHAMFLAPITDRFGVAFERDLSVTEKALLLATTIILDYMYYDV